ncbi:MAG: cytochrome P450 [Nodularia sp. CChRGM 3473]
MKFPQGPKAPGWSQKLQFMTNSLGYLETNAKLYGDIFTIELDSRPTVFVSNPLGIQQIFSNKKEIIASGEVHRIFAPLIGTSGLMNLDGSPHRKRRKLLMPPFHGERMRAYGKLICHLADKFIHQQVIHKPFSASEVMHNLSLEVLIEAVFGLHEGERAQKLREILAYLWKVKSLYNFCFFFPALQLDWGQRSPWGYFLHLVRQIDELLYAEINERRQQPNNSRVDILSLLISARDETGESMTNQELRDELLTLLVAGHETTGTTMTWLLYWTHRESDVRNRLLQELDSLGDSPDPMSIFQLPYLTAVCNESQRITPAGLAAAPRIVQAPVQVMNYELIPGTMLLACIYLTHQREDIYPEPGKFKPERFFEQQFSSYEFLPFGGGVRRCIAEALAQFEMKLVLATILSRYQLTLVDPKPEKLQCRGATITPSGGAKMMVIGRRERQGQLQQLFDGLV